MSFVLWTFVVAWAAGYFGYRIGIAFPRRDGTWNNALSCISALALVAVVWYGTCLWFSANASFDGAMIPCFILTAFCAPVAAGASIVVAVRVAARANEKRRDGQ